MTKIIKEWKKRLQKTKGGLVDEEIIIKEKVEMNRRERKKVGLFERRDG